MSYQVLARKFRPVDFDALVRTRYGEIDKAESEEQIQQRVAAALDELSINYSLDWTLYGEPFLTEEAELVAACQQAIESELGLQTSLSTSGGTSDGRFIAPTGAQVVELGPVNASIHKIDEHVALEAPAQLAGVYQKVMENLLL